MSNDRIEEDSIDLALVVLIYQTQRFVVPPTLGTMVFHKDMTTFPTSDLAHMVGVGLHSQVDKLVIYMRILK
jgi:hypothetical protein